MKIYLPAVIVTALLNNPCHRIKMEVLACVQQKIEEIKAELTWNPPVEIKWVGL